MATLVRWEPLRELAGFQTEMSRLMNGLFDGPTNGRQSWVPALDVWETDTELVYAFDLPGIDEKDVSIESQDDTLTVTARREKTVEESGDRFVRFERRYGTFSRAVGLPQGVEESKITAAYRDGVSSCGHRSSSLIRNPRVDQRINQIQDEHKGGRHKDQDEHNALDQRVIGVHNALISGAPAQIPVQPVPDFFLGRVRIVVEHRHGGHDETRRAIAALQPAMIDEGFLHRMQDAIDRQTFDRRHFMSVGMNRERQARLDDLAID